MSIYFPDYYWNIVFRSFNDFGIDFLYSVPSMHFNLFSHLVRVRVEKFPFGFLVAPPWGCEVVWLLLSLKVKSDQSMITSP